MTRLELDIELDPVGPVTGGQAMADGIHVRGTVRHGDGAESPFVGWLSLMLVLQAAVAPEGAET